MTTPVTFVLGPPTQLRAKFVAVASVIAHTTLGSGDVVNVTVPDELAVSGPPPS
jgi:protein involved in polysaccharide export with SLBB domain